MQNWSPRLFQVASNGTHAVLPVLLSRPRRRGVVHAHAAKRDATGCAGDRAGGSRGQRRVLDLADDVHLRLRVVHPAPGAAHQRAGGPGDAARPRGGRRAAARLHEELEVLVALLLPGLSGVREDLPVLPARPEERVRRHPLPLVPLVVVVPLRHARLPVDVGDAHLPLLVQLPVEGAGVLQVVLVAGVVEEAEKEEPG